MAKSKQRKTPSRTAGERAVMSKATKLASGYVRKDMLLPPDAAADLAALVERDNCAEVDAVASALRLARARNSEPSNAELARMVARRLKAAE